MSAFFRRTLRIIRFGKKPIRFDGTISSYKPITVDDLFKDARPIFVHVKSPRRGLWGRLKTKVIWLLFLRRRVFNNKPMGRLDDGYVVLNFDGERK